MFAENLSARTPWKGQLQGSRPKKVHKYCRRCALQRGLSTRIFVERHFAGTPWKAQQYKIRLKIPFQEASAAKQCFQGTLWVENGALLGWAVPAGFVSSQLQEKGRVNSILCSERIDSWKFSEYEKESKLESFFSRRHETIPSCIELN